MPKNLLSVEEPNKKWWYHYWKPNEETPWSSEHFESQTIFCRGCWKDLGNDVEKIKDFQYTSWYNPGFFVCESKECYEKCSKERYSCGNICGYTDKKICCYCRKDISEIDIDEVKCWRNKYLHNIFFCCDDEKCISLCNIYRKNAWDAGVFGFERNFTVTCDKLETHHQ